MSISVKFFARLREQVGIDETQIEQAASVAEVWQQASNGLDMPSNTLCAVNMEYVDRDATVKDGDEVAFFPPVTGGSHAR